MEKIMRDGICPNCGSGNILPKQSVKIPGHSGDLFGNEGFFVTVKEESPAERPYLWHGRSATSTFTAIICGSCGYTEFYANNYGELNEIVKQSRLNKPHERQ
jgi:predicted nucleic-acid-binding Zn-ribbon protein